MKNTSTDIIAHMHTAYKIGFSDAITTATGSAYADAARWIFEPLHRNNLLKSYYRGWLSGFKMAAEVKRETKS